MFGANQKLISAFIILSFFGISSVYANKNITWLPLSAVNLSAEDPAAWSNWFMMDLHFARARLDQGYAIGYYHPEDRYKGLLGRSGDGPLIYNQTDFEIMIYPPGTLSWYLVDGEVPLEKVRPYLISGGKDSTGSEDLYFCRFFSKPTKRTLVVGNYMASKGPICWAHVHRRAADTRIFEVLIDNLFGEEIGLQKQ